MKNRKQLPCFGYLRDLHVDIVALTNYLKDNGLLETERYNDIRFSADSDMKTYISISEHSYNNFFKDDDEGGLESLKFRQLMLTHFDQSKVTSNDAISPATFFSRFRRRDPSKKNYMPHADELNYGIRNELVKGELEKVMNLFTSQITRARLTYLATGHDIKPHVDYDPSYVTRYHIPIITHPGVVMHMERQGKEYAMHMPADGKIYFFNTGLKHWVTNDSPIDRLHLIIDVHGQSELESLVNLDEEYDTSNG
jgi:hypothetical protein